MVSSQSGGRRHTQSQPGPRSQDSAEAWLRARARLAPNLLSQSPPWVRSVFDHAWAPMAALTQQVRPLPAGLWEALLGFQTGFVAIGHHESYYLPGPATLAGREVQNLAFVSVEDLARDNERPLHVIGHLIDHHLGCGGTPEGAWLSEGGGIRPRWKEAGGRLPRLFALGYAVDEVAGASVRDYFAQSLALYCRERRRLNVADPQIDKWLHSTLWPAGFWQTEGEPD